MVVDKQASSVQKNEICFYPPIIHRFGAPPRPIYQATFETQFFFK